MLMPAYQWLFFIFKSPIGAPGAATFVGALLVLLAQSTSVVEGRGCPPSEVACRGQNEHGRRVYPSIYKYLNAFK